MGFTETACVLSVEESLSGDGVGWTPLPLHSDAANVFSDDVTGK